MAAEIEFCLLGPLVVRQRAVAVTVPHGTQRVILAMLLLNAGRIVCLDELAETLWVAGSPPSGLVAVQNYVMRLRNTLGDAGRARIITQPPGYLIRVETGELDVSRFEALLCAARAAAQDGSWHQVATRARAALELWRGEPLTDVGSEALAAREAPRLAELWLQTLEMRIEADLHLGRHTEIIAELRQLAGAHPLRERLHGQLMRALCRDGRQAEALAAYRHARDVLVAELGVEPGPGLQKLHQKVLSADPTLAITESARPPEAGPPRVTPRELPPEAPGFTGRSAELQTLAGLLDRPGEQVPGTVVISAIGGTAGVGKTALAVHWAHRVANRFPDGQLYVNLRGYDPGQPAGAADALAGLLRSLGVPGQDIPPEEDQRAARYRSLLAGKKMLIVLDNAGSAGQVRPLLPGTRTCAVLVTSRDALTGLVARDGAARLDLDVLPQPDAVALLRALIGPRVDAEPAAVAELASLCCRLPLALRLAAELAASRPAVPLTALAGELADLRTRLDLLDAGGDPRTGVRAVLSWSCRDLSARTARTFRLAGLHPGPDFEPYAIAALTGATVPEARQAVEALTRAHLIQPAAPGRYGMHDLLRSYAREVAGAEDDQNNRQAALTRLFDHYLHTAAAAMDTLYPAERHFRPRIPGSAISVPPLADAATARNWLDHERAALVAAVAYAAAHDWPGHATRLAATLSRHLCRGGHYPEALTTSCHALDAARRTGDRAAEAAALTEMGNVDWEQSRPHQAVGHYRQALALFRAAGDRTGEARVLGSFGLTQMRLCRYEEAARYQQEALAIFRGIGDRFGEARTLGNLGLARRRQGRYQEAADHYQQALGLCRAIGDREGEAWSLVRLGTVDLRQGRYQRAAGYHQQALALFQEMGNRADEAEVLVRLGEVHLGLGRYEQAAGKFEQALEVVSEIGDRELEADALNSLGDVLAQTGEADKARAHYATALRLASEVDSPLEQARAHCGLARACQAHADPVQARHHWRQALTRYVAIGAPEADEIRARLAPLRRRHS